MKIIAAKYQTDVMEYPTLVDDSDFFGIIGMEFESIDQALDFAYSLGNSAPVKLIVERQNGVKEISLLSREKGKRITVPLKYDEQAKIR